MIKKKRRSLKKPIILSVIVIVVVVGSVLTYMHESNKNTDAKSGSQSLTSAKRPYDTVNYGPSSSQDNAANNARKSSSSSAATLDNGPTATSNSGEYVTVNRASVSGSDLVITTSVAGITSGTCVANVSQSGQTTVTSSPPAQVEQQNNSYVCQNIEIPLSQFPNNGNWYVSVAVTYNGSTVTGQWDNNAPVSLAASN